MMKNRNHTWEVVPVWSLTRSENRGVRMGEKDHQYITVKSDPYATNQDQTDSINEAVANAQLIAAAPEMLEALEEVLKYQQEFTNTLTLIKCKKAVAKAKGIVYDQP